MDNIETICDFLKKNTSYRPTMGVICGSGLSGLSSCLQDKHTIPYDKIPGFPQATVAGHSGELVFGVLENTPIVCMRGRFHTYEGHDIQTTTLPVRVMRLLGVDTLIVTNAAGGLNPNINVGDVMIINDHMNFPGLAGKSPLVGPNDDRFGDRFTPLSECYDAYLQKVAYQASKKVGMAHKIRQNGVYCFVSGPAYETPTEAKFLRLIGGDSVGMSTVPEVVVAAHCGMRVLGLSLITNKVLFPGQKGIAASHQEVLDAVVATQGEIELFVKQVIADISNNVTVEESKSYSVNSMTNNCSILLGISAMALAGLYLVHRKY